MNNTDKFLELYRQLEQIGRANYFPELPEGSPIITRLTTIPSLREFKEDVEYCRVVRNFLVHTPRVRDVYPVIPSDDMIRILEKCVARVKSPTKAMSYAIRRENMFTASLNDKVINVTDYMNSRGFTHVPIFHDNKLLGVFSDNVIYSYICDKGIVHIDKSTEFSEFINYLGLSYHINEYFAFMKADATLYEAADLFNIDSKSMKKLAVIFFTDNGKKDGYIKGMMTPYSLLRDAPEYY
ncbi:MAG: hypothetical protein Q4D26_03705 [Clostridia bacterium]|nr:hypothetical protein [Clostridia bacterium]